MSVDLRLKIDERVLISDPGVLAALAEAADPVVDAARAAAPVRTGALRRGIRVEVHSDGVRLVSADWKSAIIIKGSTRHKPNDFLRRALESMGYQVQQAKR